MANAAPGTTSSLFAELKATKRLPSPPGTAIRVLALCRREDADLKEIAEVIMADPALTARLLKFANSPLAGIGRAVSSVREALLLLGLRTVKLTALGFSLATPDKEPNCSGFDLKNFWAESFLRAVIAKRLAGEFFKTDREEAFTAGLLAGLGQLALAHGLREKYSAILRVSKAESRPIMEVEREQLGTDHLQVSAQLMQEWALPPNLVQAVGKLTLTLSDSDDASPSHRLARVVQVAYRLTPHFVRRYHGQSTFDEEILAVIVNVIGTTAEVWETIVNATLADFREMAEVFDVLLDNPQAAMELCAEAQEEATRVGMVAQIERTQALADKETLIRKATTDPLTGIANRAKFDERLETELARVKRGHGHCALLLIDIDLFKKFNDVYGHQVGDLVLKRVATAAANMLREVDLVARYGGEEFAIIAPHTDRKGSCIIAIRLQRCIEELKVDIDGKRLGVTISSGLVNTMDYEETPTAERLIADADKQMYLSKDAGRNTWSYLGRSASGLAASAGSSASAAASAGHGAPAASA